MISIITVNFNGYSVTVELLQSLERVGFRGEVIVVDNGSASDEADLLKDRFKWITAIRSETNLGFAGGNNLGILASKGDLIMLLNNDTTVKENFEAQIEHFFTTHPLAGAVSPKIKFEYKPLVIQFAGYEELSKITLRNTLIGFKQQDQGQYQTSKTPYAHGAAMVVRRKVVDNVGLMPENYFLYYEELDWCESIRRAGWEIWYLAEVVVYHKESWSTGKSSPLKTYYLTRNRLIFANRNLKSLNRFLSISYQLLLAVPVKVVKYTLRGDVKHVKSILKAVKDYVTSC